ncbi:MarR family transcriptional regulator (plasmid) [Neorhizobium sp. SOG26]|uniref:MarR family winged helix-turn-helix transcriptional regulator n=1 Tax=Neorhizobium turbinariae TaxID=2937795 RepID=A0ABT0INX8_9HYPH|nr:MULTISPECIES: MarR family winged helix-turn-helix transcriptional regulator [Neorhizobium]AXV18157.1 MarR family transcriptional regulator [Neorhizobium sp. SOG26]MCK8779514.1 MarR family winged helix-turn-helix transcriptional regulator [Neorhizobium turbinariae]
MHDEQDTVGPFSRKTDWPYYWVTRVSARYINEMEKLLKPAGLDVPRWRVLSSLREHSPLGVSEISDYCILKLNTTTKIVQRMVADGLVTTRSSPQDARVTEVSLTKKGEEAAIRASHFAEMVFDRTFADFKPDEIAQMNQLLKRLFEKLG